MPRKLCVVTGSRADYGHLYGVIREIAEDGELTLQLVVTGMHLAHQFGATYRAIEDDDFAIDAKVDIGLDGDARLDAARALGRGVAGLAEAFQRLAPDIVVVLGDRFEILAAAQAAVVLGLPLAHIHGGEATEGAIDDSFRHAITKMAHLHFAAAEAYGRRIVQMGEMPERVFTVGAPGLDAIGRLDLLGRPALEDALGCTLGESYLLVTYHPVTIDGEGDIGAVDTLLSALDEFPDHRVLITGVNADPDHDRIARRLNAYAEARPGRAFVHASLGQRRYLSAIAHAAAVVGNSSSGLIEAPALKVPTVNLGSRQRGRLRAASVIDCGEDIAAIAGAIERAIAPDFRRSFEACPPPYAAGDASKRIKDVLKTFPLEGVLAKPFRDLEPVP